MKKLFIILIIGLFGYACSEEKVGVYSLENDYIYFQYDVKTMSAGMSSIDDTVYYYRNSSSLNVSSTQQRDTFVCRVLVAGVGKKYDRKINLAPYVYALESTELAISGVNYIAFDNSEMEQHLIIPADSVGVNIPIIVTYDSSIAGMYKTFTVGAKLLESEDFKVMEANANLTSNPARSHLCVRFTQSN